jgi:peptidyl-prolyl cis-trans isomerase A (cyclophilin A)
MKKHYLFKGVIILIIFTCNKVIGQQPDSVFINIQTSLGNIKAVLFTGKAPVTCANFISYIKRVGLDGGEFYRTVTMDNQPDKLVKIEVIQGGFNLSNIDIGTIQAIKLERTSETGVLHNSGTLSMARDEPDSGTSEFFICIGDQPSLDFGGARNPDGQGFAAFGRVAHGMEVVKKIQTSSSESQKLTPPVKITKISIE